MQDVLQILDGRTKRAEGYSYKLSTTGNYGIATAFDTPAVDESKMAVRFPFASGQRRDGVGDLLEIGGIRLDRHRQNPVCLYDHGKTVTLPCAKALDPDTGLYTVDLDLETQTAWVKAFFYNGKGIDGVEKSKEYDHALFCEQLFDLIAKGFVRAGSIGYQVIKGLHLPADPASGTPPGLHLISVLMLEASAVVMPANQDTVMKALALSSVCGKPMSPVLHKSLSSYVGDKVVRMGYEGKSVTVPVPLEKLPDTQIPPAKWKPGAGAIKSIPSNTEQELMRALEEYYSQPDEYGDKADGVNVWINRNLGKIIIDVMDWGDENIAKETVGKVAESKVGKENIEWHNEQPPPDGDGWQEIKVKTSGKSMQVKTKGAYEDGYRARLASKDAGENPHKEGDSKTEWYKGWEEADKRVKENKQQKALRNKYRPKPVVGTKSLDLRKKYRSVKKLRHKLKSGQPGAAIVHIGEKDMAAAKQLATSRGIKFAHLGTGDTGLARIKLIGADDGIDEVAKHYGRAMKSTATQRNKSMSDKKTKVLKNNKKKAMDDVPADVPDDAGTDSSNEKWGAQMMRRAHEDHGILMKDYDEMMGVLEDDEIHKHFSDHMGNMSKFLDDTEKLWTKKYDNEDHNYEPLNKDLTEDEAEDVGDELVEETEDTEADDEGDVEDKDADTIDDNAVPADDSEEEEVSPDEVVEGMHKRLPAKEVKALQKKYGKGKKSLKGKKKSVCAECGKEDCKCDTKDLTSDELENVEEDLDTQVEDTEADPKSLQPHEHAAVGEAAGFLREKSAPESQFGEEDRYKSYHYHKTLDGIGQVEDMAADDPKCMEDPNKNQPGPCPTGKRMKSDPMPNDGSMGPDLNIDGEKQMHPHRKACKDASTFFKQLAMSKDFGDPHRQAAGKYAEILEGVVGSKAENTMNPEQGTHTEPGAVAGKEFEEQVRKNGERIKALMLAIGAGVN